MHAASSAGLPGSNSRPAPVPSMSSASPPVRATTSGAPPASASRATIPNGSYSDGMTTHPARWTVSRSRSSGRKPGQVDEVADALEVDLRLQLGEVAAAAADDALDARHPRPQQPHRPGEDLEALLVLDPAPREHERRPAARRLARRPPVGSMPLGIRWVRSAGSSNPPIDLADDELRAGEHLGGVVGEPRLDGVDRARLAGRHPAAVLAALGGVERGDELGAVQRRQRVGGPGDLPVVGVDDVGAPVAEPGGELHEVVVGRGDPGDELVVGQPRQIGAGPQHADGADGAVGRGARVGQGEQHDVVAGAASAWLSPSTWAATPPTDRGGNSQVSIRTRIGAHPNPAGVGLSEDLGVIRDALKALEKSRRGATAWPAWTPQSGRS